jgi:hypothetical protein
MNQPGEPNAEQTPVANPSDGIVEQEPEPLVDDAMVESPEPANLAQADQAGNADREMNEGDQPRRRRRRRGGRRHRRRLEGGAEGQMNPNDRPPNTAEAEVHPDDEDEGPSIGNEKHPTHRAPQRSRPTPRPIPQRIPPKLPQRPTTPAQPVNEPVAVVRTGSADKHLVSDEPIAPQPASRPRSYRDLDAIPDDYD